jgi:hypothetical protein
MHFFIFTVISNNVHLFSTPGLRIVPSTLWICSGHSQQSYYFRTVIHFGTTSIPWWWTNPKSGKSRNLKIFLSRRKPQAASRSREPFERLEPN